MVCWQEQLIAITQFIHRKEIIMITVLSSEVIGSSEVLGVSTPKILASFAGLSTDTKATDVVTGSIFIEVDTGDVYFFNEASSTWVKQYSLQA